MTAEQKLRKLVPGFITPDGENDWHTGSETFTRKEVANLLWTQIAMISNDMKREFDLSEQQMDLLGNPRIPNF